MTSMTSILPLLSRSQCLLMSFTRAHHQPDRHLAAPAVRAKRLETKIAFVGFATQVDTVLMRVAENGQGELVLSKILSQVGNKLVVKRRHGKEFLWVELRVLLLVAAKYHVRKLIAEFCDEDIMIVVKKTIHSAHTRRNIKSPSFISVQLWMWHNGS